MKIIFLDFDGVLVNKKSWYVRTPNGEAEADPDCIAALNLITDATGARIVISSSWRIGQTLLRLKAILFQWHATGKVVSKTPSTPIPIGSPIAPGMTRGKEIDAWLKSQDRYAIDSFVILDDDGDMHPHLMRLVQTHFDYGLTKSHAQMAIRILEKK